MPPHRGRRGPEREAGGARERLDRFEGDRRRASFASESPGRTIAAGRAIGELLPPGAVLSLEGGLGAGKTLIAKGICAGLGVADEVTSPSFVLAEEYTGAVPVLHFDLYRLESVDEVARIGLFDAIDGANVVIVEWGDRLPAGSLDADVRIVMEITGDRSRGIAIEAPARFLEALERSIA
jgi:tRNA threonylcarbamoyladenosine biosynthesis protein TsaE